MSGSAGGAPEAVSGGGPNRVGAHAACVFVWRCGHGVTCVHAAPKRRLSLRLVQGRALSEEEQQEALLRAKYGGLLPKKKQGPKDHKFFDSADWALSQQGQGGQANSQQGLEPKLGPTELPGRRTSHLGPQH